MNNPFVTKFAAQAADIILTGVSTSRTLQLLKGSQLILKETYNYDTDGGIRVSGLADVLTQALYGELIVGVQNNAQASVTVKMTGEADITSTLYTQRLLNPRDPQGQKVVLAAACNGVCYPGTQKLVTVIGQVTVGLVGTNRTVIIGNVGQVTTVDCDPAVLFPQYYDDGTALNIGSELLLKILPAVCADNVCVRFLNRYDVPETVVANYMTDKPQAQDDTAMMFGRRTRFDVKSTSEYTLYSGQLHHEDEVDTWQDLLTARKAQVLLYGQWNDVVITKSNLSRDRRNFHGSKIEISFQTANPLLLL